MNNYKVYRNNWFGLSLAKNEFQNRAKNQIDAMPVSTDLVIYIIQIHQYHSSPGEGTTESSYCCVHDGHIDSTLAVQNTAEMDPDYPEQSLDHMGRFVVRFDLVGHPDPAFNTTHQIFKDYNP